MQLLQFTRHNVLQQTLWLLAEKALYWKEQSTLIIADLHFGKAAHFRKSGIPLPPEVGINDLDSIDALLTQLQAKQLIFLGDLLHSEYNHSYDVLKQWIDNHQNISIHLVKGNHDIVDDAFWKNSHLFIHQETFSIQPFIFSHHPAAVFETHQYYFCGHIHPAIILKGKAKQSVKLPCFYFTQHQCILPAFGSFTGNFIISPNENEIVFGIAGESVVKVYPPTIR